MKNHLIGIAVALAISLAVPVLIVIEKAQAQETNAPSMNSADGMMMGGGTATTNIPDAVPVTEMPEGYRDWRVISVAHEEGNLHSFAIVLGNDAAIKAYREGTLPFPDGTMIAALHYRHVASEENNKVFGQEQSFVPGAPSNVQFMIKDSKLYATTGGWGFGHFVNGKPLTDPVKIESCYECHAENPEHDLVFAHYAP
jgi:hypothetical protein